MTMLRSGGASLIAATLLLGGGTLTSAQTGEGGAQPADGGPRATSSHDRLFLAFAEEAVVADRQWWEGQVGMADADTADVTFVRAVVAFQPWEDVEIGGRVGFGDTEVAGGSDGSGATDLDVWGKYYLGGSDRTEWAAGGMLTVPTGDETAGLGNDSFAVGAFGSVRHRLERLILAGHGGLRFNGDGRNATDTADRDGETSVMVGAGVILPFSDHVAGVAEARYEDGRLEGDDSDARVLGGVNWRPGGRGMVRAALTIGLTDGAPDSEIQVGYAAQF
jgi:hypothetical protein